VAAGRHRNLEGRHATLHMDPSKVASGPTVHEGEQRGESVGSIGPLWRRGRPVRGPRPRDIRCEIQTPAAPPETQRT